MSSDVTKRRIAVRALASACVLGVALGSPTVPPASLGHPHHDHGGGDLSSEYLATLSSEVLLQEKADPTGRRGAGGRAVVHRAGGKRIRSPRLERTAPQARLYRTGTPSFEPTLGVTKSGAIFFNGFTPGSDPLVVASYDEGATWKTVFQNHAYTLDPYLYVDPDTGRIFANDLMLPCHFISYSDDDGKSWSSPPPRACEIADHQTLFTGPPPKGGEEPSGYPNVVYFCGISLGVSVGSIASACVKSLDGGDIFGLTGEPAFINDPRQRGDFGIPGNCNGANAHGSVGPDGTVYLPRGWCGQPWLAISKDEGATWTRVQVADNGMPCCGEFDGVEVSLSSHEAAAVADKKGRIYYVWVAADRLPYLSVSRDEGETWSKPLMIGSPGLKESLLPGLVIGKAGRVAVVYMGSQNSPWNGAEVDGSYDKATWNAYVTMSTNAADRNPLFYSATINAPSDPMWIGRCGPDPIRCNWGDFFDIVIGPDGTPWAALVDLCQRKECSQGFGEGVVGRLVGGPKLR